MKMPPPQFVHKVLVPGARRPAAIFDLDGTLIDSKPGITKCINATLHRYGVQWDESLDWFIGPPAHLSLPQLLPMASDAERNAFLVEYRAHYAESGWADSSVYGDVFAMPEGLKSAGWDLFVCTSKREDLAIRVLDRTRLRDFFIAVYADSPEATTHSKVDLLGSLLAEQRLQPEFCYMIGDRYFDIEAAREHGVGSVAVLYGYGSGEELNAANPDFVCQSPIEVKSTLLSARCKTAQC